MRLLGLSVLLAALPRPAIGQDVAVVLHAATELESGDLAAALSFRSGRRFEPADRPGLVDALVASWNARALAELEAGGLAPNELVTIHATEERIVLRLRASEDRLAPLLGRIVARLAQPDYNDHASLTTHAQDAGHTRIARSLRWLVAGQLPSAKNQRPITSDDLLAFHQSAIGRVRARLDIVGSPTDAASLQAALASELEALPSGAPQPRMPPPVAFPTIEQTTIVVDRSVQPADAQFLIAGAWSDEATPLVRSFVSAATGAFELGDVELTVGPRSWKLVGQRGSDLPLEVAKALAALSAPTEFPALATLRDAFVAAERERAADPDHAWSDRLDAILAATSPTARSAELDQLAQLPPEPLAQLVGRVLDPDRALVLALGHTESIPALTKLAATTVLPTRGARGDELGAVVQLEHALTLLGGRARWAALKGYAEASQVTIRGLDQPVVTRVFRRFDPFAVRLEQESRQGPVVTIARPDAGWTIFGGAVSPLTADQRRNVLANARDTMPFWLHRIATEDDLRVRYAAEHTPRLEIYGRDPYHTLVWFALDPNGRPTRFGIGLPSAPEPTIFELSEWIEVEHYAFPSIRQNETRGLTTQSAFQPNPQLNADRFEPRVEAPR